MRVVIPLGSESLCDVMNKYVIEGMDMLSEDSKTNVKIVYLYYIEFIFIYYIYFRIVYLHYVFG